MKAWNVRVKNISHDKSFYLYHLIKSRVIVELTRYNHPNP